MRVAFLAYRGSMTSGGQGIYLRGLTRELSRMGHEIDVYVEWAKLLVHGSTEAQPSRRYAAGMIALRPDRDGKIVGYEGLDAVRQSFGEHIVDMHAPPPGSPTQGVEGGYMANAWIRMRHPDYDELRLMLDKVGEMVQVQAG